MHAVLAGARAGGGASDGTTDAAASPSAAVPRYELCFRSLLEGDSDVSFPCDAQGRVDIDALSEQARCDYLYARAVMGRVFERPRVRAH